MYKPSFLSTDSHALRCKWFSTYNMVFILFFKMVLHHFLSLDFGIACVYMTSMRFHHIFLSYLRLYLSEREEIKLNMQFLFILNGATNVRVDSMELFHTKIINNPRGIFGCSR